MLGGLEESRCHPSQGCSCKRTRVHLALAADQLSTQPRASHGSAALLQQLPVLTLLMGLQSHQTVPKKPSTSHSMRVWQAALPQVGATQCPTPSAASAGFRRQIQRTPCGEQDSVCSNAFGTLIAKQQRHERGQRAWRPSKRSVMINQTC